jgi:hypothetical protein
MKKSLLLLVVAAATLVSSAPSFAQAQAPSSGNKMKDAAGKVGNAIMWGPRKIGAGFKKVFHKGS